MTDSDAPDRKSIYDEALAAYVDVAARIIDAPIGDDNRRNVQRQFARIAAFARFVAEHPLDIVDEAAPVFHSRDTP